MIPSPPVEEIIEPAPRMGRTARLVSLGHTYLFGSSHQGAGRTQAIRGTVWVLAGTGASQVLRAAATIILARRFIGPREFGLVALVTIFVSGLSLLSDLGVGTDVVRHHRGDDPDFLSTAFLIQAGRGVILFGLAAVLAYPFAAFYHEPKLTWLVIGASLQVVIQGFTSTSIWTLTRNVETDKLSMLTVLGDLGGLLISVGWAMVSPTAWAIVAGTIANATVNLIGSYLLSKNKLSLQWNSQAAREIFAFGAGMFLSSVTFFFVNEAERLVVAKFITAAELGCFSLAVTISILPGQTIGQVISRVFFPMISKTARTDMVKTELHFRKARQILLAICACFSIVFICFSQTIVDVVLGPKYRMAGWMLQLLGFRGAFQLFSGAATVMLFALGYSRYAALGNGARLVFLAIGLSVAFTWFGFKEAVWVLVLSQLVAYIPLVVGIARHFRAALHAELWYSAAFLAVSMMAAAAFHILGPSLGRIHLWAMPH